MLKFSLGDIHLKICYMVHWYKFRCLRISWCTAFDTPLLPLPNQELEQLHDGCAEVQCPGEACNGTDGDERLDTRSVGGVQPAGKNQGQRSRETFTPFLNIETYINIHISSYMDCLMSKLCSWILVVFCIPDVSIFRGCLIRHPSVSSFAFLNWATSTTEPTFLSVNPPDFFCFFLDDLPLSSRFLGGSNKNTSGFVHSRVSPVSAWCVTASFTLQGASQGQVACKMCNGMYEINLEHACVTFVLLICCQPNTSPPLHLPIPSSQ